MNQPVWLILVIIGACLLFIALTILIIIAIYKCCKVRRNTLVYTPIINTIVPKYDDYITEEQYTQRQSIIETNTIVERITEITDEECPITQETFQPGDEVRKLPCGHIFLKESIEEWLFQKLECPICRNNLGS